MGPVLTRLLCWALAEKASWLGEQPQFWSKAQVLDWISYQVEKNKYDASSIDFSRCDMDGATLCNCALEELRLVFGPLGDHLHAQLRDLSESRPLVPQGPGSGGEGQPWARPGAWAEGTGGGGPEGRAGEVTAPSFFSASSSSDELSWIIELLEKDGMAFQDTLGDPGPFGEDPFSPPCPAQPVLSPPWPCLEC